MRLLSAGLSVFLATCFAVRAGAAGSEQITDYTWSTTGPKVPGWKRLVFKTDGSIDVQCHPGDLEHGTWKAADKGSVHVQVPGDEYLSDAFLWFSGDSSSGYTTLKSWDMKSHIAGEGKRQDALTAASVSQPPTPSGPEAGGGVQRARTAHPSQIWDPSETRPYRMFGCRWRGGKT